MGKSRVAVLAFIVMAIIATSPGWAATVVSEAPEIQTSGNFSIRIFISTTISMNDSYTGFNWTFVHPGMMNQTASNYLNLSIDPITNTVTDVYLKSTSLASGGNTISVPSNLVVDEVITKDSHPYVLQNNYRSGPNQGYFENVAKPSGSAQSKSVYMFLTVPNGTIAGYYSGTFTIKIVGNGVAP